MIREASASISPGRRCGRFGSPPLHSAQLIAAQRVCQLRLLFQAASNVTKTRQEVALMKNQWPHLREALLWLAAGTVRKLFVGKKISFSFSILWSIVAAYFICYSQRCFAAVSSKQGGLEMVGEE